MLFEVQKSDGSFDGLFGGDVGHTDQLLLCHIFLSRELPIIDDCTKNDWNGKDILLVKILFL